MPWTSPEPPAQDAPEPPARDIPEPPAPVMLQPKALPLARHPNPPVEDDDLRSQVANLSHIVATMMAALPSMVAKAAAAATAAPVPPIANAPLHDAATTPTLSEAAPTTQPSVQPLPTTTLPAATLPTPATEPESLLDEIRAPKQTAAVGANLGASSFAVFQKAGASQNEIVSYGTPSFGLSSGLVGKGCSALAVNNVDQALFVMPNDVSALTKAYLTATGGAGIGPTGTFVHEPTVEPFVIPQSPHLTPIEKYEAFCFTLLAELQQRQPRNSGEIFSVWFQQAMRQSLSHAECWELPQAFRRQDIKLSAALIESLRGDSLLYSPLSKLSKKCLLSGVHVPARLVATVIAQASSRPERLVQDAIESRMNAIHQREPPSVAHLSRYLSDIIEFCSETPPGAIQQRKLEDKVMEQIGRVPALASDVILWRRRPWAQRSWLQLVEAVKHFEQE